MGETIVAGKVPVSDFLDIFQWFVNAEFSFRHYLREISSNKPQQDIYKIIVRKAMFNLKSTMLFDVQS